MATCDVSFHIEDAGGNAVAGALIRARAVTPQSAESDATIVSRGWVTGTTDASGDATIALQQQAKVRVTCDEAGLDYTFTVPGQSNYVFARELAGVQI